MGSHFGNTKLPVELTDFSGKTERDANILTWKTALETGLRQFHVERSPDGYSQWQTIGIVIPDGIQQYDFTDKKPLASSFYRLYIEDISGEITYSHIISLQQTRRGSYLGSAQPNPFNDVVFVECHLSAESDVVLRIHDAHGRLEIGRASCRERVCSTV